MQSPTRNYTKKTRKPSLSTFSQPTVQTDVGDFKGGYFVSLDSTKENERSRGNSLKQDRSPGRRKQQANESNATTSPDTNKEHHSKFEYDYPKKPFQSTYVDTKDFKKESTSPSKMYNYDSTLKNTPPSSKNVLSTSPTNSDRWAGPAFGNAPPPSSLPLPEFPPMNSPMPSPVPSPITSPIAVPQSHQYASPYHPMHGMTFQPLSASPPHYLSTSPHQYMSSRSGCSSIPATPFPYVHSTAYSSPPSQSLSQLSTDLRRLLNIDAALDSILVANSS